MNSKWTAAADEAFLYLGKLARKRKLVAADLESVDREIEKVNLSLAALEATVGMAETEPTQLTKE